VTSTLEIPIDGTFVPKDGQFEHLLGNIGRQFIKQFPEAEFVDEIDGQVDLPLALGHAEPVELSEGPFRIVVVVSILRAGTINSDSDISGFAALY
jgi:hypothetical protein